MFLALALVVAAQADVIDAWYVPMWGSVPADSDSGGDHRVVALGSRINLWSIACRAGGMNEAPFICFPARLRLPEYAACNNGAFPNARAELARLQQCFDVRLQMAPPSLVAVARTGVMADAARIVQQQSTPTLAVVAWTYTNVAGLPEVDVFMQMAGSDDRWLPVALPPTSSVDEVIVGIVHAPGAHGVVEAIRAKKFRTALARAQAALKDATASKDLDDHTKSALRANVASAAILAGSKRDVIADDGFNDVAVDNGTAVDLARRWARGEVWLGADPCL